MSSHDPSETIDELGKHGSGRFEKLTAVYVAIIGVVLAIFNLGGANATKDALNANIAASNAYAFYQARNIRQNAFAIAADSLTAMAGNGPGVEAAERERLLKLAGDYRKQAARQESRPTTSDGKKELLARARKLEKQRDHALTKDPYFDVGEALLQIAIVLASVSIIAGSRFVLVVSGMLAATGALAGINGFLLLVDVGL